MPLNFQDMILALQTYWSKKGCIILQPYDLEMGAGTFHPATTLRALGPDPWNAAYVQPCRRPADGRYGQNPNRLARYLQFQVILKPAPEDIQDLYLNSLRALGMDLATCDIRFVEDDWESPTLGASGLGWEVWRDGMEITQFTYFQKVAGIECDPVCGEITYGLERIAMHLQGVEQIANLRWNDTLKWHEIEMRAEEEFSQWNFRIANTDALERHFHDAKQACGEALEANLATPAYDQCLKASHMFNLLDARGAVSAAARQQYIAEVRGLAQGCAKAWLDKPAA